MEGSKPSTDSWNLDIGMAIISDTLRPNKRFFNRESLKNNEKLEWAERVLVCLSARKYQFLDKSLLGAGWGTDFEQTPSKKYSDLSNKIEGINVTIMIFLLYYFR